VLNWRRGRQQQAKHTETHNEAKKLLAQTHNEASEVKALVQKLTRRIERNYIAEDLVQVLSGRDGQE
jgi:hypothetical protein